MHLFQSEESIVHVLLRLLDRRRGRQRTNRSSRLGIIETLEHRRLLAGLTFDDAISQSHFRDIDREWYDRMICRSCVAPQFNPDGPVPATLGYLFRHNTFDPNEPSVLVRGAHQSGDVFRALAIGGMQAPYVAPNGIPSEIFNAGQSFVTMFGSRLTHVEVTAHTEAHDTTPGEISAWLHHGPVKTIDAVIHPPEIDQTTIRNVGDGDVVRLGFDVGPQVVQGDTLTIRFDGDHNLTLGGGPGDWYDDGSAFMSLPNRHPYHHFKPHELAVDIAFAELAAVNLSEFFPRGSTAPDELDEVINSLEKESYFANVVEVLFEADLSPSVSSSESTHLMNLVDEIIDRVGSQITSLPRSSVLAILEHNWVEGQNLFSVLGDTITSIDGFAAGVEAVVELDNPDIFQYVVGREWFQQTLEDSNASSVSFTATVWPHLQPLVEDGRQFKAFIEDVNAWAPIPHDDSETQEPLEETTGELPALPHDDSETQESVEETNIKGQVAALNSSITDDLAGASDNEGIDLVSNSSTTLAVEAITLALGNDFVGVDEQPTPIDGLPDGVRVVPLIFDEYSTLFNVSPYFTYSGFHVFNDIRSRFDPGLDTFFLRTRSLDHQAASYTTKDPLGFQDGPNPYAYASGDPVNLVDTSALTAVPSDDTETGTLFVGVGFRKGIGGVSGASLGVAIDATEKNLENIQTLLNPVATIFDRAVSTVQLVPELRGFIAGEAGFGVAASASVFAGYVTRDFDTPSINVNVPIPVFGLDGTAIFDTDSGQVTGGLAAFGLTPDVIPDFSVTVSQAKVSPYLRELFSSDSGGGEFGLPDVAPVVDDTRQFGVFPPGGGGASEVLGPSIYIPGPSSTGELDVPILSPDDLEAARQYLGLTTRPTSDWLSELSNAEPNVPILYRIGLDSTFGSAVRDYELNILLDDESAYSIPGLAVPVDHPLVAVPLPFAESSDVPAAVRYPDNDPELKPSAESSGMSAGRVLGALPGILRITGNEEAAFVGDQMRNLYNGDYFSIISDVAGRFSGDGRVKGSIDLALTAKDVFLGADFVNPASLVTGFARAMIGGQPRDSGQAFLSSITLLPNPWLSVAATLWNFWQYKMQANELRERLREIEILVNKQVFVEHANWMVRGAFDMTDPRAVALRESALAELSASDNPSSRFDDWQRRATGLLYEQLKHFDWGMSGSWLNPYPEFVSPWDSRSTARRAQYQVQWDAGSKLLSEVGLSAEQLDVLRFGSRSGRDQALDNIADAINSRLDLREMSK